MELNIRILQFSNGDRNANASVPNGMRSMSLLVVVCCIVANKIAISRYKLRVRN